MTTEAPAIGARSDTRRGNVPTLIGVLCCLVVYAIFPGDSWFRDDEAALIGRALRANQDRTLASMGLGGSFGYGYGPLVTQVYQIALLITHDLRAIIAVRSLVFAGVIVASMWVLADTLRLRKWFAIVVLAAPWPWWQARILWDNTFTVPLGFVAFAAYAHWLSRPARINALLWSAALVGGVLVHLGALPMAVAMFVHAAVRRWADVRRWLGWIALGAAVAASSSVPYIVFTADQVLQKLALVMQDYESAPLRPQLQTTTIESARPMRLKSAALALRGAWLLSGDHFPLNVQRNAMPRDIAHGLLDAAMVSARGAYLWMLIGACTAVWVIVKSSDHVLRSLVIVAAGAIGVQAIVFAMMNVESHSHYLSATLAAAVLLCWIGVDWLWRRRWLRAFVVVPACAAAACTAWMMIDIHHHSGGRNVASPTLGNLISLADSLKGAADADGWTNSPELAASPAALLTVRELCNDGGAASNRGVIVIRFANRWPRDGLLVVDHVAHPPAEMERIPLRPHD